MARNRRSATHHGWIVIDKPAGWTSHDVVARVRRDVGERRVGHAGTLDPAATGVLPIAIGLATRTVEYLADADKSYRAWIRFGTVTDTDDGDGSVIAETGTGSLTLESVLPHLDAFRGKIQQRPPAHSAIWIDGERAYHRARRGEDVDMPERTVTIHSIDVVSWQSPELCIDVTCSKGTYIRSIARDLGAAVGTGAHLARLIRTRSGPFDLAGALSLDEFEAAMADGGWGDIARPPDAVLGHLTPLVLDDVQALAWSQGKPVQADFTVDATAVLRAYNAAGSWLGVGNLDRDLGIVRPSKVIPTE
jgi:tRNA pseudouridine55 synthase